MKLDVIIPCYNEEGNILILNDKIKEVLNNINYQKCYLEIINLEKNYQKEGYHLLIKIPQKKKKIMEYFKE